MPKTIKIAAIQFSPQSHELKENLNKATNLAKTAIENGAKIVVLPELFDSGYCVEDADKKFAIDLKDSQNKTLKSLQNLAKKDDIYIVANVIEKAKKHGKTCLFDTAFIMAKKGIIGKHRKIYLWGNEPKRFKRGDKYRVFELKIGKISLKVGLQICYEIGFGEGARALALNGAELIIYTAAFGTARSYVWDLASRARALENGAFVIAANRAGSEISQIDGTRLNFAGKSKIISPKGEIIAEFDESDEGILSGEIDLDELKAQRENLPYLAELNINLHKKILSKIKKIHFK